MFNYSDTAVLSGNISMSEEKEKEVRFGDIAIRNGYVTQ
jgi:hypothetical protein